MLTCRDFQLAMGVLATLFGGSALALRGGNKTAVKAPPLNASSSDEADFIKYLDRLPHETERWTTDAVTGSSWRRPRQRRTSRRPNTRRPWGRHDRSLSFGVDCTTIDWTDTRSIQGRHTGTFLHELGECLIRVVILWATTPQKLSSRCRATRFNLSPSGQPGAQSVNWSSPLPTKARFLKPSLGINSPPDVPQNQIPALLGNSTFKLRVRSALAWRVVVGYAVTYIVNCFYISHPYYHQELHVTRATLFVLFVLDPIHPPLSSSTPPLYAFPYTSSPSTLCSTSASSSTHIGFCH